MKKELGRKILCKYFVDTGYILPRENEIIWGENTYLQVSCSRKNDFKLQEEFCGTSRKEILTELLNDGTDYLGWWRAHSTKCV